ncbi:MAG TPA: sigma-70 family RNA polymerase sigma factor [Polyangia bacterium]
MHPKAPLARTQGEEVTDPGTAESQAAETGRDEQRIIDACLSGTPAGYRVLVQRYQRAVLAITYRLVGNRHEAEELSQQSFVDAYTALAGFRRGARFSSWLYRIAVNNSKDFLKSKKRTEMVLDTEVEGDRGQFSATFADPETALATRERDARLMAAIQRLPFKYRTVLVLKDIEDLPYEEIGAIVRRPLTTLKIRVVRARKMLRAILEQEERL